MGNSYEVVSNLRQNIKNQDRTYAWLARQTGIPYKRILNEVKHGRRPLSLETTVGAAQALGLPLDEVIQRAA